MLLLLTVQAYLTRVRNVCCSRCCCYRSCMAPELGHWREKCKHTHCCVVCDVHRHVLHFGLSTDAGVAWSNVQLLAQV